MDSTNKLNQNSFKSHSSYENRPSIDSEGSQRHSLIKKLARYSHFKPYSQITHESQELNPTLEQSQFSSLHSPSLSLLLGLVRGNSILAGANKSNSSSLSLEESSPSSSYSSSNVAGNCEKNELVMKPSSVIQTPSSLELEFSQTSDSISSPLSTSFTNKRFSFFHLNSKNSLTTKHLFQFSSLRHPFSNSSINKNYNNTIAVRDNIPKSDMSVNSSVHASSVFSLKSLLHSFSFYKHSPKYSKSLDLDNLSSSGLQANIVNKDCVNCAGSDCKQIFFFFNF